jgi:nitrite reductase (NADH) small subunit
MTEVEINLGPLERIPRGEGRAFDVSGRQIAVFRTRADEIHATEALCPHRQGPLADGFVGRGRVVCPLHAFHFELATGAAVGNTCRSLVRYEVRVDATGDLLLMDPSSQCAAA